jgi:AICAR transformylase/IMP cyclohydrolase PurH
MKALIAGVLPFDVIPLVKKLQSAGCTITLLNAEGAQQALQSVGIAFESVTNASAIISDLTQVEIVLAGLGDHSLGRIDVGTHALVRYAGVCTLRSSVMCDVFRACAAKFESVAVVVEADDCELISSRLLDGPSISLSVQQRRLLAAKAFSACAAVDNRIAVELHHLSCKRAC